MDAEKQAQAKVDTRKNVSERKRTANCQNAKKSTGPKTPAGKERSKMNAETHGLLTKDLRIMTGEAAEDPAQLTQLLAGLREHYKPVGMVEDLFVQKIADYLWREPRAQRFEAGAIQREVEDWRDMETARSQDRLQAARTFDEYLLASPQGIQHLLDGLATAIAEVQRGDWSVDSATFVREHFGHRIAVVPDPVTTPAGRAIRDGLDDTGRKQLRKELPVEYDRLLERLPEVQATEKQEGDARVRSYTLPNGKDLDLELRYATANDKMLHKAMDRLRQVQADRRKTETRGAAGGHPAE